MVDYLAKVRVLSRGIVELTPVQVKIYFFFVTHIWALAGPNCIFRGYAIHLFSMLLWLVVLADKLY